MRVSWLASLLAIMLLTASADAAPVLLNATGTADAAESCTSVTTATNPCSLFTIDPFASTTLTGSFEHATDLALFQFVLDAATLFSVTTTSYMNGGFDPSLGLFYGLDRDPSLAGRVVTYSGAEGDGPYRAVSSNIIGEGDEFNLDDVLIDPIVAPSILLDPGSYMLALVWGGQLFGTETFVIDGFSQPVESVRASLEVNDFGSRSCATAEDPSCAFSLSLTATPADVAAVPEPGTLSLLGLGVAAAAIRHRRSKRPHV